MGFPGQNTQHQLQLIIQFLGTPHAEELRKNPNGKCRKFIESLPAMERTPFEETFPNASGEALDFVRNTLHFDPDKRLRVQQALQHVYLSQLYCPEDEPTRPPLDTSEFEFQRRKVTIRALREELFLEALQYHPEKLQLYLQEQMQSGERYDIADYRLLDPGESQYSS